MGTRQNAPKLLETRALPRNAISAVLYPSDRREVFNLVQGFKRNWHLPTWQHHPLEEATELALCGALVVEVRTETSRTTDTCRFIVVA